MINHYKDPYEPTSIMESSKGFFRGSNDVPFQELVSLSSNHIPRERVEEVRFFLFDGEWIER